MSANLARLHATGPSELALTAPIDEFRVLDRYAGGFAEERPRVPWLATISAGYLVVPEDKSKQPYPTASRKKDDHWIHMTVEDQDRAPGLYAALVAGGFRWLDVAVASDDPSMFLQQHFEKRSASRLEVFGDERELTEIMAEKQTQGNRTVWVLKDRLVHVAGSERYETLVHQCNVSVSFFFTLAKWDGREPRQYFPASDGLGVYRLRFTSRNSLREILASLRQVSALTRGRLAGLPLRLFPDFRSAADPTGVDREIVVWKLRFMPPEGLELTPKLWQDLARAALAQGDMLHVPLPALETLEDAAARIVDVDLDRPQLPEPTGQAVAELAAGGRCDATFWQHSWFARVKGSGLDSDEARAGFIEGASGGRTDSLTEFLRTATEEEAAALIAAAGHFVGSQDTAQKARRYEEIFGTDDAPSRPPTTSIATSGVRVATPEAPDPAPTREQKQAELKELLAKAKGLGLHGETPGHAPGQDPVDAAIAYWHQRFVDLDLDKKLAAEQAAF